MKTLSPPVEVALTRKATLLECLLAAVASGALLAFALPPFDVPLLGFVALAPMMAAVLRASAIPALICTLLTGIVSGAVMTAFLSGIGDGFGSPTLALAYFAVFGAAMWFPLMGARVLGAGRSRTKIATFSSAIASWQRSATPVCLPMVRRASRRGSILSQTVMRLCSSGSCESSAGCAVACSQHETTTSIHTHLQTSPPP